MRLDKIRIWIPSNAAVFTAFLLISFSGSLFGQQVFGSIYGTVTDKSGGAIANAKVIVTDLSKNTKSDVVTNDSGNYNKGQLIPGTYQIQIEAAGFSKVISSNLDVTVDQAARFDVALAVGSITEQVEVTAAAPLLQTDRADVAQTYTSKEVSELPNFGRNVQSFELLTPGTSQFGWNQNSAEDPQGGKQIQVNGQAFSATGFQLDGTSDQDPILGEILINPPIDAIAEVKQASQDYDAEFGYVSGGMLTYSTKSGSNAFHGSAFEYLYLNTPGFQDFARNPFNSAENKSVPTVHWNQFGGSLGGKIIKNKLFFFGDAQLTRRNDNESVLTTVPTAAARTGDFSGYINNGNNLIYDPNTGDPATGLGRMAFLNNKIPTNRLSPQAVALLNYFPLPNTVEQGSGLNYRNNYATTGGETFNTNQWDTRWDYYGNEKNTYFGRYSYAGFTIQAPGAFGMLAGGPSFSNIGYAGSSDVLNQSLSAGWTHTASPTLVNELRFGYMRYRVNAVPNGVGTTPATAAGIPGLNLDNYFTSGMPAFFINGDQSGNGNSSLGYALNINSCNCPLNQREQQYQIVDNVTKMLGNHNVKFGADLRRALNLRVPSDAHRSGELTFGASYTGLVSGTGVTQGYGLASFLLGETTAFRRYVSSSTDAQERQKRGSFYAQDAWRATSKLTVTYGLRWELVFPETVNQAGNGSTLDLSTGNVNVFGLGNVSTHGIQNMNWHIFAPRLGLAYQLTPKTVVRMGAGVSYSMGTFGSVFGHNVTQNLPVLAIQSLNAPQAFSGVFNLATGPVPATFPVPNNAGLIPLPNGVEAKTRPQEMTLPEVLSFNLTVERQLTRRVAVSAGYVGNQGRHQLLASTPSNDINTPLYIPGDPNINDGRPFYSRYGWTQNIDYYCNCSNNQYNSFQTNVKVQNLSGYTLNGSYTYQVAKGDGYGSANSYTFLYDRPLGYGNEDYIAHNQLTLAQNLDIPFGRGRKFGSNSNRFVNAALGGWNISGITTFYSGLPFTPSFTNYTRPSVGPNDRPNVGTGSPYAGAQGNRNQWFVGGIGGAFLAPAANTFGNFPVNSLYGPHFINQDISLGKSFSITEKFKFTLRGDAVNSFNHTNLGQPNANVGDPHAGQITGLASQYQMRRLQFSGRFDF